MIKVTGLIDHSDSGTTGLGYELVNRMGLEQPVTFFSTTSPTIENVILSSQK